MCIFYFLFMWRNMVLCAGFYKIWKENIHSIIKKLRESNSINWLRTRMYYHRFPNLGELIQWDLVSKPRKGLAPKYFVSRERNCKPTMKVHVRCAYKGECRRCCVVYKVTPKCYGDFYVGNIQNVLKKRMEQNSQDVSQKVMHNKNLDSFANHFAKQFT